MSPEIKICGMRDGDNIRQVAALKPDYLGFIFYPKSPRYAGEADPSVLKEIPEEIRKVGVFVDEASDKIRERIREFGLDLIQLHGEEPPVQCRELREVLPVVKAVSVRSGEDIRQAVEIYRGAVDFFLFDTRTPLYGGSGEQFDWDVLNEYDGDVPFFLSGGIGPGDAERIPLLNFPLLAAIDINSRFETEPGRKDPDSLGEFFRRLERKF